MNKLEGFFELQRIGLPSVPWKKYDTDTILDEGVLWTVRTAIFKGDDLNLPRKVGVSAKEAKQFANELIENLGDEGFVIYYPYFIADKSGVIEIALDRVVVEAVKEDLWNLVTYNKRDITVILSENNMELYGEVGFLSKVELDELLSYAEKTKRIYRNEIIENKSFFMEWSYAYNSDINKNSIGNKELVFYEIRSV